MLAKRIFTTAAGLVLLGVLTGTATAQRNLIHQPNERTFDASIVSIDRPDRTMTVMFKKNHETETYPVAKNAEFYYFDGAMDIPKSFSDLSVGESVMLEFSGVKGKETLSKVTADGR